MQIIQTSRHTHRATSSSPHDLAPTQDSPRTSVFSASLRYLSLLPLLACVLFASACSGTESAAPPNTAASAAAQEQDRDRKFSALMNGVIMKGRSTSLSHDRVSGEEQYIIEKVTKLRDTTWLVESRFKVGEREFPISMPVQIEWAGDTPVLCVTDFAIPGMGTYTARVVLHSGQYAGTWNGKGYGGQMFGVLVPIKKP